MSKQWSAYAQLMAYTRSWQAVISYRPEQLCSRTTRAGWLRQYIRSRRLSLRLFQGQAAGAGPAPPLLSPVPAPWLWHGHSFQPGVNYAGTMYLQTVLMLPLFLHLPLSPRYSAGTAGSCLALHISSSAGSCAHTIPRNSGEETMAAQMQFADSWERGRSWPAMAQLFTAWPWPSPWPWPWRRHGCQNRQSCLTLWARSSGSAGWIWPVGHDADPLALQFTMSQEREKENGNSLENKGFLWYLYIED